MEDGLAVTVNRMADSLSRDELRRLRFLCSDLLPDSHVEDLRGALISRAQIAGNNQSARMILKELMFHLKRFDILKKVLGTSRQEVEHMLNTRQVLSGYRVLMADLSEDLAPDDLHSLVFLFSSKLARGKLDTASSFLDLVDELEKLDEVSPENLDLIEQGFRNIHRLDLAKKIQSFQKKGSTRKCAEHNSETQRGVCSPTSPPSFICSSYCADSATIFRYTLPLFAPKGLKLPVAETRVHYQQATEEYIMETIPRGVCIIIDCVGCDGDMLKQTFEVLGFRVILHTLLCLEDTFSVLRELSQSQDLQGSSAFICCLLSRGLESSILTTESCGPGLRLDDIRQRFNSLNCSALRGKPKLFLAEIYEVQEDPLWSSQMDQCLETDAGGSAGCSPRWQTDAMKTIPVSADVLSCVCLADDQLLAKRGHQSVFWQTMRSTLLRCHGRRIPLLDALTEVNRVVLENPNEGYRINLSHTLRKTLYL
ncbi:CASP8 and FADD-like apoptosis regulator a [Alosa alosa]|uniref:CASP8 and FADD-like apoptosis regulator a n=1 Tax=Alosa alosa TaxID=278164 RepID=UPI00201504B3|nr:CASP8 and FADD-like apoptosis regulator a [Alosa alosa]XP_048091241.1 CASP8 and FADD-like apoptosis regulator a [Alosa alosa]XP_048091242.1 CASP8 and FADD-like apoptosis regulator a [Alosa alosa]XP_048091243.1 CASP8 and FADD-like apoptosis regulator a [Alosa alosa]